ncbi:hypothetical protein MF672_037455 [Actinomadura sp. ATCC 31491]|uniref:Phenylacetate--CoA ligase family protein n=1 Tax=Actinomadura luzonensis TaxID=2805427 RepID=A0ABT0G4F3_9ACTN|nr:hypothetical protein [Actinomadura luzonensis]MCK2219445.1 hypothetical protein [Actinomadura luzonensis]
MGSPPRRAVPPPGVFLADERAVAVSIVLAARMRLSWLGAAGLARVVARGGRLAGLIATGGHFMAAAGATRLGPVSRRFELFSVHRPLPELVAALNRYRPAVLLGYGSVIALLAAEQAAGRLRIDPVLVEPAGESLSAGEHGRIAAAFPDALIRAPYGGTECTFLSDGCAEGWYHVNTDWAVLEPVDAGHRPTPPGEYSHTVLLSNLANRVQPILRYDLGDSVLMRPGPCPCGDLRPALRVQGRAADVLTFPGADGGQVSVAPLALATLADRTPGVEQYQVVQSGPAALQVRLRPAAGADPETVWQAVRDGLTGLLAAQGLAHVTVERAAEPPRQSAGGKYRTVIPLTAGPVPAARP